MRVKDGSFIFTLERSAKESESQRTRIVRFLLRENPDTLFFEVRGLKL